MSADRIPWYPGFASAMQLELSAYRDVLTFETEHELNRQPLRIDLLVVKKNPNVHIENDVAAAFRGHNVMEFKSEQDSLTIDDLSKALAYGHLYKSYGPTVDAIRFDDVTVTLVRRRRPEGLFASMASYGHEAAASAPGIYRLGGLGLPVQVVITDELDPANHIWLASLASDLETIQLKRLASTAAALEDKGSRELAEAVMDVVTMANSDAVERLKKEDDVYKTLREIMQPEIDEAVAKARLEAAVEAATEAGAIGMEKGMERGMEKGLKKGMERGMKKGLEQGLEQGMEQGRQEGLRTATRAMVERLLRRGGFSEEEVADLAGTTVAEVRSIAQGPQPTLA